MTNEAPAQNMKSKRWFNRFDLGVAGFMMSLGLTLAGLYSDARGSDIAVRPLDQMLLYRDGEGDRSVLSVAFKLVMLNAADSSHGDMLLKAELEAGGLRFPMGGTVQPSFSSTAGTTNNCPLDSRCVVRPGFVAVEKPDEVLDIAGGSHLLTYVTFPIVSWNCVGPVNRCAALSTASGQQGLFRDLAKLRLTLHLYADGERVMTCSFGTVDLDYMKRVGWSAIACKSATVQGGPLI